MNKVRLSFFLRLQESMGGFTCSSADSATLALEHAHAVTDHTDGKSRIINGDTRFFHRT